MFGLEEFVTWGLDQIGWDAQKDFAREQRDFSARREDSAVQRRVSDLKAAGLNPMLGYMSSAQSSMPPMPGGPAPKFSESIGKREQANLASAQAAKTRAEIGLINSQHDNIDADTALKLSSAGQAVAQTDFIKSQGPKILAEIGQIRSQEDLNRVKAQIEAIEVQKLKQLLPYLIREGVARTSKAEFGTPTMETANQQQRELWQWLRELGERLGSMVYERGPGARGRALRDYESTR